MTALHQRLVLALLALALSATAAAAAQMATLKGALVVAGDQVTLGDLFTPESFAATPEVALVAIAPAPKPGQRMTVDAAALQRVALKYGLEWPNAQRLDRLSLERESIRLEAPTIEAALIDAIAAKSPEVAGQGRLRVRFAGPAPTLHIALGAPATLKIVSLDVEAATGQFRARVQAPADDPSAEPIVVVGRAYGVSEIPTLARDIQPGEALVASDFTWTEVARERLSQNIHTSTDGLIGKTPKRPLRAGEPLRFGDVEEPIVIAKDALVSMIVRGPGMTLTAQGRALEAGALGHTIRVLNTSSKRTVEAVVQGPGEVLVATAAPTTLARN